jgi:LysM repeat protein
MMSRRLRLGLGLGCLAALLLTGVIGIVVALGRIPPVEEQVARSAAAIVVSLREPAEDTTWPANSSVPVYALVTGGEAITSAELWANGGLLGTGVLGPGASSGHAPVNWSWNPDGQGDYTLVVRAQDALGRMGVSQPILIHVSEPAGPILVYSVQPGDTLDSISQAHGVTPEQLGQANPGAADALQLVPGSILQIQLPPGTGHPRTADGAGGPTGQRVVGQVGLLVVRCPGV